MKGDLPVSSVVPEQWLGDVEPLLSQVGSPGSLSALARAARTPDFETVTDAESLRRFLADYHRRVLRPVELPSVAAAFGHAARFEPRELIELDLRIAGDERLARFAIASRHAGRTQLRRLVPLKDHRVVQRYANAVRSGRANGWHTVVYGLILASYSIPLRQGLLHYARQTTLGFVQSASGTLQIEGDPMVDEALADIGRAIDSALAVTSSTGPALMTG